MVIPSGAVSHRSSHCYCQNVVRKSSDTLPKLRSERFLQLLVNYNGDPVVGGVITMICAKTGATRGGGCKSLQPAQRRPAGWLNVHNREMKQGGIVRLTKREQMVISAILDGNCTYRRLGEALGISPRTAAAHLSRIYAKVGVENMAELVLCAVRAGLLEDEARYGGEETEANGTKRITG